MAVAEERELLRQSMDVHRREFREAVEELQLAARHWTDPRDPIRERPMAALVGGMLTGLWLGLRR